MTWAQPLVLVLAPVALAAAWWVFRPSIAAESAAAFKNIKRFWADRNGLADSPAIRRWRFRGALLALGAAGALFALARPQWGSIEETSYDQAREVLIALDLSRSMLAADVAPTRLARAKLLVESLLDQLHGERVGLAVFAGTSFLQSPMSADYEVLRDFLAELEPSYLPQGGTDYHNMLRTALKAFGQEGDGDRYLVVLSDGEAHDEQWREMIPALRQRGIRVIGLGVGTPEGAVLPDVDGGLMKDENGAAVLSRLEPKTLQELAEATGGSYRDAATWVDIAELVHATVDQGQKGRYVEETNVRLRDQYQWFLAPALLVLFLSYWLELPVFPVPRVLRRHQRAATGSVAITKAAAAIVLAIALATAAQAASNPTAPSTSQHGGRHSRPYSSDNRPSSPSGPLAQLPSPVGPAVSASGAPATTPDVNPLETVVSALAAKPDLAAGDYAMLANTTIEVASQRGKIEGPPRTGVIDDALRGVGAGEALDAKAADWLGLRQKLEELKQTKNDPPPPSQQQDDQQNQQDQQDQQDEKQDSQNQQNQQNQQSREGQQNQQNQQPNQSGQGDSQQQPQQGGGREQQQNADSSRARSQGGTGEANSSNDQAEQQPSAGGEQQQADDKSSDQPAAQPQTADNSGEQKEPKALKSADAGLGEKENPPPSFGKEGEPPATRMVGGGRPQDQSVDSKDLALVDAVDRMNRVKDGDAPAVLFDRMNQAEGQRPPDKNGKNW